jgi:hypothetical protein
METFHRDSWRPIFDAYVADDGQPIIEANVPCLQLVTDHLDRYCDWANEKGVRIPRELIALARHLENVARSVLKA